MTNKLEIEISAAVDDAIKGLQEVKDKLAGVEESSGKLTGQTGKTSLSLTDLKSGIDLARQAFGLLQGGIEATVGATVAYAAQVRDLSRDIGASAEETSKLIQVADDTKVSYETLRLASKNLIKEGIQPSIANLGRLADEYNDIQDPVEKTQFLLDKFGRAGLEMGKMMVEGSAGIRASADEAEHMGLVLDEKALQSARELEIAWDNLGDRAEGLKLIIGKAVIPVLVDAAEGFENLIKLGSILAVVFEENTGQITHEEAVARTAAVASGDLGAAFVGVAEAAAEAEGKTGDLTEATGKLVDAQTLAEQAADKLKIKQDLLSAGLSGPLTKAQEDYQSTIDDSNAKTREAVDEIDTLNRTVLDNAEESAKAQTRLAELSGTLSDVGDRYEGARIEIDTLNTVLRDNDEASDKANERLAELKGTFSDVGDRSEEAQAEIYLLNRTLQDIKENSDNARDRLAELKGTMTGVNDESVGAQDEIETLTLTLSDNKEEAAKAGERIAELNGTIVEMAEKSSDAQEKMNRLTNEFIYQKAAAGLDADAALELARAMGLIDEKSYNAARAVQELKTKYDLNRDGAIDAAEAARGYTRDVESLADRINNLQDRTVTVTTRFEGGEEVFSGNRRQSGGPVEAGTPYLIHENEIMVPQQSGYVLSAADARDIMREMAGIEARGSGTTQNIGAVNINNRMDAAEFLAMLRGAFNG